MWPVPMSLRARLAAVTLIGIFFLPFATSDLRGINHLLSCEDEVTTSLYVENVGESPVLGSADSVTRDEVGVGLCGGLSVDLSLTSIEDGTAGVEVAITNDSTRDWQGSIELRFDGAPVPVPIGSVARGSTERDHVSVHVGSGDHYEIVGTLRIGP